MTKTTVDLVLGMVRITIHPDSDEEAKALYDAIVSEALDRKTISLRIHDVTAGLARRDEGGKG